MTELSKALLLALETVKAEIVRHGVQGKATPEEIVQMTIEVYDNCSREIEQEVSRRERETMRLSKFVVIK